MRTIKLMNVVALISLFVLAIIPLVYVYAKDLDVKLTQISPLDEACPAAGNLLSIVGPEEVKPGDIITVELRQDQLRKAAVGYQAWLRINPLALQYVSHEYNLDIFGLIPPVFDPKKAALGILDFIAAIQVPEQQPTAKDAWLVRIKLRALETSHAYEVGFSTDRQNYPPIYWAQNGGLPIHPCFTNYYASIALKGDQNRDGVVDRLDKEIFWPKYLQRLIIYPGDVEGSFSDIVQSGRVDEADRDLFLKNYSGPFTPAVVDTNTEE